MKLKNLKPGTPAPVSGTYERRGPRDGAGPEAVVPKGHILPPGPGAGYSYDLVRRAKNKSGRGG